MTTGLLHKLRYFLGGGMLVTAVYDYVGCIQTVRGLSMSPTLNPGPDLPRLREKVWVSKWELTLNRYTPRVGDIVVFKSPKDGKKLAMKRIAGIEGDVVTPSKTVKYKLNPVLVKPGHVWVEADNPHTNGRDSNEYGQLHLGLVTGLVKRIIWPYSRQQNLRDSKPLQGDVGTGSADIHAVTDSICYAGGQSVIILSRDTCTFKSRDHLPHGALVRTTTFVKHVKEEVVVLGCDKGHVKMWWVKGPKQTKHICQHSSSVSYLSAVFYQGSYFVVSCGTDSTVRIHAVHCVDSEHCVSEHSILTIPKAGHGLCCELAIYQQQLVLAVSTDNCNISLYQINSDSYKFLVTLSGHEDWVRSLAFKVDDSDLILASGSQDNYIRIWRFMPTSSQPALNFEVKKQVMLLADTECCVRVENILLGHENWVTSVRWLSNGMILSSSMDKTLILWSKDADGLWSEHAHVGEVGGNNMGLFGAFPTSDNTMLISHSFQGAFQGWHRAEEDMKAWQGCPMPGGHFASVKDISWSPSGAYLVSASLDQVHGHDMSCVDTITDTSYVSGSEEKVLRAFQAPTTFVENVKRITGRDLTSDAQYDVLGAHIPALGLSNKAISSADMNQAPAEHTGTATVKDYEVPYQVSFAPVALNQPPVEEILLQNTLWPEVHKLYGHGYEVYQCAASPDGAIIATCCKATKQQFAAIILWSSGTFEKLTELVHHNLTVTRVRFSPDSSKLLSVSRDREWVVWDTTSRILLARSPPKAHARIIWDCAWFKDNSGSFMTVSRDKTLRVWEYESGTWELGLSRTFDSSVTAVDVHSQGYIAVGFETGGVAVLAKEEEGGVGKGFITLVEYESFICPSLTINTLQWRPSTDGAPQLAICSDDSSVAIFNNFVSC